MSFPTRTEQRGPSLWAILLILAGGIWLLAQANVLTAENLSVLFRVWPLLLIGIGLEILIGRRSRGLSTLIILGTIGVVLVLMLVGPTIGLSAQTDLSEAEYSHPLEGAESAEITVGVGVGNLNVRPLTDATLLFDADIRYTGDVQYDASERNSSVAVTLENNSNNPINTVGIFNWFTDENNARWDIGVSPSVPVELDLSTGTGGATLDLRDLQLTGLTVDSGTGGVTMTLPAVEESLYDALVSLGTGGANLTLEDGIAVSLRVSSGTGSVTIDVPDDAPVRIDAETGTGGISVPSFLTRISGEDGFVGDGGVWQSDSYASADENARITIHFEGGTGGLTVR